MNELRPVADWFPDFCKAKGYLDRPGFDSYHPEFLIEGADGLEVLIVPETTYNERRIFTTKEDAEAWIQAQDGSNETLRHHLEKGPVYTQITRINSDGDIETLGPVPFSAGA